MSRPQRSKPIYTPPGGPAQVERPHGAILDTIETKGVFRLLSNVYRRLEATPIRPMFAPDMELASQRSAAFFVQLMGGEPLYSTQYGPPRMRQRHLPFEIDEFARKIWLECFRAALQDEITHNGFPAEHLQGFETFLDGFSKWMVNVAPAP
jgi:hemoglobin